MRKSLKAAFAAVCVCGLLVVAPAALAAKPIGAYTTRGAWSFYSAPNLHPPKLKTDRKTARKLAHGYFILANFKDLADSGPLVGQSGPLIVDSHLQPVWFDPVPQSTLAMNLEVQSYNGQPVLTWWQGVISKTGVTISGEDVVVDQHYRTIATLTGADGWVISPHEMVISGDDAYVTAYKTVGPMNLTAEGGSATGLLLDSAVQEYNLTNGDLMATWDALGHIPLTESKTSPGAANVAWDAYHVNSIELFPDGSFLVSMRNTWGVYMVDNITSGDIEWTLGAGSPDFKFGPHAAFAWQHDVELQGNGLLTMFDDECCEQVGNGFGNANGPSRGLVLKLNTVTHTATLVAQYEQPDGDSVSFLGSMQTLPGGNTLVGWGNQPYFSEFSSSGKVLLDAVFPGPDNSYRALLENWVGEPLFPPAGAVRTSRGKTTVYASWDGATQVAKWRVLAGSSGKHLTIVATVGRSGFETAITLSHSYKAYKVQALNSRGHVLGSSGVFPKKKHTLPFY